MKSKILDLARELTKVENMKVMVIPIVIGAIGTVTKGLVQGLEDEWRPFKLQHYKDRLEYRERSWILEETCCHSNSSGRPTVKVGVKIFQKN